MTCRDVENWFVSHATDEATRRLVDAHLAECERCRRLARALATPGQAALPPPGRLREIEARVMADLEPVTPLRGARVLLPVYLSGLVVVVAAGAGVLGIAGWHALSLLQRLAIFSALAASTALLAASAERQIVPGSRLIISPRVLIGGMLAVMAGLVTALFHPHHEPAFVPVGIVCLKIGLESAMAAGAVSWLLLLARGAILRPILTGATAGALAGLTGLAVLELICPNLNAYHILVWHVGSLVASTGAGIAIGAAADHAGRRHH